MSVTSDESALIQRYENLVSQPVAGIQEIASHILGFELDRREAAGLALEYSLAANRQRTFALTARLCRKGTDLDDPKNSLLHDSHTLLRWNHLRDGRVGAWRDLATACQCRFLANFLVLG